MIGNVNQPSTNQIMDVDGTLKAGAVDVEAVLADNVVTAAKIADNVVGAGYSAGSDLTLEAASDRIGAAASASGSIATSIDTDGTLKAGAVDVAGVLASNVVEAAKIAAGAVTSAKLYTDAMAVLWGRGGTAPELRLTYSGTSITLTLTAGFYISGIQASPGYVNVPALSSTTLANTQCIYLDVSTPASPTWSGAVAPSDSNLKNNAGRILAFVNLYGVLYSPIATLQHLIDKNRFDNHVGVVLHGIAFDQQIELSVSGNNATLSMPAGFVITSAETAAPGYVAVPALSTTTLTNTQCIYLDLGDPAAPAWSGAVANYAANVKDYPRRLLVFSNFYGRVVSPIAPIQSLLDAAYARSTTTTITVAASGGDYTTIAAAIAAATPSEANPVEIVVAAGTYNEYNLTLPAHTTLRGAGRGETIIVGSLGGYDGTKDVILANRTCTIRDLTIQAHNVKYCVHSDSNTGAYEITLRNVHMIHTTGFCWGIGTHAGQYLEAHDCIFEMTDDLQYGVYLHNWNEEDGGSGLLLQDCSFVHCGIAHLQELGSDHVDHVRIHNCTSGRVDLGIKVNSNGYYYAGGTPDADLPYCISLSVAGGYVPYMEISDRADGDYYAVGVWSEKVRNDNASTLAAGTAVAYDYAETGYNQAVDLASATRCDGVLLADTASDAYGYMVRRGNCALVLCDTAEVARADWLKPNASTGEWEAATEAAALAVALGTKSAGSAGLVKAKLL